MNDFITKCDNRLRVIAILLLMLNTHPTFAVDGFNDFWLAPTSQQAAGSVQQGTFEINTSWVNKFSERSKFVLDREDIFSTLIATTTSTGALAFTTSASKKETSTGMAINFGAISVFANYGKGDSYSRNNSIYNGMDPYSYHGGNLVDYRYSGTSMGLALGSRFSKLLGKNSHLQAGQTTVFADRLEDRKSTFIDFSNDKLFARYTRIERGNDYVGYGFDAGVAFGKLNMAYQELSTRTDVSTRRVRFNWNQSVRDQFWLDFTVHDNAALEAYSDNTAMISWRRMLGVSRGLVSYAAANKTKKKTTKGINRGILIGGAVAAAAILASSGSSSQDNAIRTAPTPQQPGSSLVKNLQAQHDAAQRRFNEVNPLSTAQNREYGGYVYQAADGSYATTEPIIGDNSSVSLPPISIAIPNGTFARASYHTHAAFDPRFDSENFSSVDLAGDRSQSIDGYLATPGGAFKYHDYVTGNIVTIGTVGN